MNEENIRMLLQYGYTEIEARFLSLAAIHSGYFTCRQFNEFTGQERGGIWQRFVEKLLARRHAQFERYQGNWFVYHVRAKGIYSRLGQFDNRNRRDKAPFTVKRRVMCLDFVLAHRDRRFLGSEADKVDYFVSERQIDKDRLPSRHYQAHSEHAAERFFVDKLPIFIDGTASTPMAHFAYVDEGAQSVQGFTTFLRQYRPLFESLASFEVVYAACDPQWFATARSTFARIFRAKSAPLLIDPVILEMIEYFEVRRKLEARTLTGLSAARIAEHREEKRKFAGEKYDQLYDRWLNGGAESLVPRADVPLDARFRTHLLAQDYEMFGSFKHAS